MALACLISIKPKWCELIVNGEKTIEVRKTKPKLQTPFVVYIYCTKPSKKNQTISGGMVLNDDELYRHPTQGIKYGNSVELMARDDYDQNNFLNGKVIGEFVCNQFTYIEAGYDVWENKHLYNTAFIQNRMCISNEELHEYLYKSSKNCGGWAWHISDLVIYDKPKDLSEFRKAGFLTEEEWLAYLYPNTHCHYEAWAKKFEIARPPQSWCYVEELSV